MIYQRVSPRLLVLTHTFSFRRFDGAPEPTYNDTLEEFDISVTRSLGNSGSGQIVLIETFGEKRNYYFYVTSAVDGGALVQMLSDQFSGYNLSMSTR